MDDERQLIDRSQHGDLVAFNELVDRYQTQAYNLALRILGDEALAADATQESPLPGGPGDGLRGASPLKRGVPGGAGSPL